VSGPHTLYSALRLHLSRMLRVYIQHTDENLTPPTSSQLKTHNCATSKRRNLVILETFCSNMCKGAFYREIKVGALSCVQTMSTVLVFSIS
jgi:hypothetical protein